MIRVPKRKMPNFLYGKSRNEMGKGRAPFLTKRESPTKEKTKILGKKGGTKHRACPRGWKGREGDNDKSMELSPRNQQNKNHTPPAAAAAGRRAREAMSQGRRAREVENQKGRRAAKPPAKNKVLTPLFAAFVKGAGRPQWQSGG